MAISPMPYSLSHTADAFWKDFGVVTAVFVCSCLLTISKSSDDNEVMLSIAVSPMPHSLRYKLVTIFLLIQ